MRRVSLSKINDMPMAVPFSKVNKSFSRPKTIPILLDLHQIYKIYKTLTPIIE